MILLGFQLRQLKTNKLPNKATEDQVFALRKCLNILEKTEGNTRKDWALIPVYDADLTDKEYTYVE